LRVRLRDCNPPRNPWKHGRGRGRLFHHNGPAYRKFHFVDRLNHKPQPERPEGCVGEATTASTSQTDVIASPSPSPSTDEHTLHDDGASPPPSDSEGPEHSSSPAPDSQKEEEPQRYREWYDELDAAATQGHHSLSVSPSLSMFPPPYPYMFHNVPYYGQPGPWMQPYVHQQVPYPVPYFNPYPVYPPVIHGPSSHPIHGAGEQGQFMNQAWASQCVAFPVSNEWILSRTASDFPFSHRITAPREVNAFRRRTPRRLPPPTMDSCRLPRRSTQEVGRHSHLRACHQLRHVPHPNPP
jgi:hypothetical protein